MCLFVFNYLNSWEITFLKDVNLSCFKASFMQTQNAKDFYINMVQYPLLDMNSWPKTIKCYPTLNGGKNCFSSTQPFLMENLDISRLKILAFFILNIWSVVKGLCLDITFVCTFSWKRFSYGERDVVGHLSNLHYFSWRFLIAVEGSIFQIFLTLCRGLLSIFIVNSIWKDNKHAHKQTKNIIPD